MAEKRPTVTYQVLVERKAEREMEVLPEDVLYLIGEVLDDLGENPRPPGAKKLTGKEGYRIRKGAYRVLYTIDDPSRIVRIYRIGHRREVYR